MHDARYTELNKAAAKIRSANLRDAVLLLIDGGWGNANDTVFLEKTRPISDWGSVFFDSVQCLLSYQEEPNRHVNAWFAKHGITF